MKCNQNYKVNRIHSCLTMANFLTTALKVNELPLAAVCFKNRLNILLTKFWHLALPERK